MAIEPVRKGRLRMKAKASKASSNANPQRLYVGVDVAKADFAAATVWREQVEYWGKQPNTEAGCAALVARIRTQQQACGAESVHLLIEPTGGLEAEMVEAAYHCGWLVTVVNLKTVHSWAQAQGQRAKTDRQDALMLAQYGADENPAPQQPLDEEVAELDSLLSRRADSNNSCAASVTASASSVAAARRPYARAWSARSRRWNKNWPSLMLPLNSCSLNRRRCTNNSCNSAPSPASASRSHPACWSNCTVSLPGPTAAAPPSNLWPSWALTPHRTKVARPSGAPPSPARATLACAACSSSAPSVASVATTPLPISTPPYSLVTNPRNSPSSPVSAKPLPGLGLSFPTALSLTLPSSPRPDCLRSQPWPLTFTRESTVRVRHETRPATSCPQSGGAATRFRRA